MMVLYVNMSQKRKKVERICELCLKYPCKDPRCPNYTPKKSNIHCSYCGERIAYGEEYIENYEGKCRHEDCFEGRSDLLNWLGYEIKIME